MDIEEIRIQQSTVRTGSGVTGRPDSSSDGMSDAPRPRKSCPFFCMPSAEAIADAIIRRTLTEFRG